MKYNNEFSPRRGETILDTQPSKFNGRLLYLIHVEEGEYPAGAGMRFEKEHWGVVSMFEGSRHGKNFSNSDAAKSEFKRGTAK